MLKVGSDFLLITVMDKGDRFPVKKVIPLPLTFEQTNVISCAL